MKLDPLELKRLRKMLAFERKAVLEGYKNICGIDEAGRGPLAGPVVAAACILPFSIFKKPGQFPYLNDSKQLTADARDKLFKLITSHDEVIYGIGMASEKEIDEINIYHATLLAMQRALINLKVSPCVLLVDGIKLVYQNVPAWKIVQGDALALSIAAASVLAKVTRDKIMREYHLQWPEYGFFDNKGYSTKYHQTALKKHGPCPKHRESFQRVRECQLKA